MIKRVLGAAIPAMLLLAATPAAAVVSFTSLLEYKAVGGTATKAGTFGQVLLEELDPYNVRVTVTLAAPEVGFVNTGGPHEPFLFNLSGDYKVTVSNRPGQDFAAFAFDSNVHSTKDGVNYASTPFGNFTSKIGCCQNKNGGANADPPPLVFNVYDSQGITFAGIGATFDSKTGKLLTLGSGDHFLSNDGGWWFAADLVDDKGNTFNVAARDAFRPPVPEPATWALMIVGFGVIGAALRQQRTRRPREIA